MKIDKSEYEVIYNKRKNGESVINLAKEYGVKQNSIYRIIDILGVTADEQSNLYYHKKAFEKEKNIKRVKDLAEKYDIKITLNDEKDECSTCEKVQDIFQKYKKEAHDVLLEKDKRIKELELELQKQSQTQINTHKQKVSQKKYEKEFWLNGEYEEKTLNILKGYTTKSRSTKVKLNMLKTFVEKNNFSFQDDAPERYQIIKLIQEKETEYRCNMLKKYSSIYENIIKTVW